MDHLHSLVLSTVSQQLYKNLYLVLMYVFLKQFAVVVDQSSYRVLSQHTIPNLTLHCPQELVGYLLLCVCVCGRLEIKNKCVWVWGSKLIIRCVCVCRRE